MLKNLGKIELKSIKNKHTKEKKKKMRRKIVKRKRLADKENLIRKTKLCKQVTNLINKSRNILR